MASEKQRWSTGARDPHGKRPHHLRGLHKGIGLEVLMLTASQTAKIGALAEVSESEDPEGLRVFYYLVQDLKALVFSLISLHFKVCYSILSSDQST